MVLDQWLALIMLRATGPWCVHQSESRELKKQYYHAWIFLRGFRDSHENFKGWFYWELRSQCWTFSVVSIRRFEFSRSNELYFDIYLTDFVILSMHIASIRSLFKMPHRSTTFACISVNLTFVMAVFFISAVGFLFSVTSTRQPRWKFIRLVYVGFNKG